MPFCQARNVPGRSVDDVLGGQEFVPFGVSLHQAVFDPVVDHFGVVAGADAADVHKAVGPLTCGTERVEDGECPFDVRGIAARHQAVTVLEAPDPAGHAAVRKADSLFGQRGTVLLVFGEPGVAAVDHEVTGVELGAQFGDHGVGDLARGDHDPDQARRRDGGDEFVQGGDVGNVGVAVKPGDLDPAVAQPFAHVEAHFSKAD